MPTELLDQVLTGQQLAPGINDYGEAMRAAALFGRRRSTCVGLTWGYYGGPTPVGYVPHGTVTLTASATNYVEADPATYLPTVNVVGFTAGSIPIRTVVTDGVGATSESSKVVLQFAAGAGGSYTLPIASASVLGGIKIGTGLAVDPATGVASLSYSYTLPTATASVLGGVKVGAGLAIDGGGVLSATYSYTLPTAAAGTLGGVMVGAGLTITAGTLSAPYSYTLPTAAAGTLGGVKVGTGLAIDGGGVLSTSGGAYTLPTADGSTLGGVKVGTGLAIDGAGVLSTSGGGYTLPTATASVLGGVKVGTSLSIAAGVLDGGIGKVALTQPATGSTLTVADGKTLTASNTLTLAGADGTTLTMPGVSAEIGYLGIPQNAQSAAYTLVLADKGKHLYHPSADTTARIWTIPANASVAFPIGTTITFVNANAGGVITIAITTDTMRLAGAGTTGSRTMAANGNATALKVTATEWQISGTNLT